MLKDALQWLAEQINAGTTSEDLEIDDPEAKHILVAGTVLEIPKPIPPRQHTANSLDDLIAEVAGLAPETSAIFFCEDTVKAILDNDNHRCESATFHLKFSDQFIKLGRLKDCGSFDQKSFIRLLKIDLAGCLPPVDLLEIVRRIKFENGTTVRAEVGRQKESLGRELRSQIETERDIPDEVMLNVPIYKSLGERDRYCVQCSVEVDPMQGTFRLAPLPDELERVQHLAMASIRERLTAGLPDVPIFYGSP